MSPNVVNHSQSGNVFMLGLFNSGPDLVNPEELNNVSGAGASFAIIFFNYFGRYPSTFYFLLIATATAVYCAVAPDYPNFEAARILNGFFSAVTQAGGLVFIKDMFFFHEQAS